MKNTISEPKDTVEGIKSRLDKPDDWISKLMEKVGKKKKTPGMRKKRKRG